MPFVTQDDVRNSVVFSCHTSPVLPAKAAKGILNYFFNQFLFSNSL